MKFKYEKLCARAVSGNISEAEKQILDTWLRSDKKNQEYFKNLQTVWNSTEINTIPEIPDIDNEWKKLNNLLDSEEIKSNIAKNKPDPLSANRILFSPKILRPVLATVVILIIFTTYFVFQETGKKEVWQTLNTFNKEQIQIQLSDGSIVKMNSGSKIEFPSSFSDDQREVKLYGEAFFSIKKDKNRPFRVTTDNAITTVLGTKFNVFNRGEKTEVIVKEGVVKLASLNSENDGVKITKDELSYVRGNNVVHLPEKVDADYRLGWLDGKLVFNNTPLVSVKNELIRYYDVPVKLEITDDDSSGLTGTFKDQSIEEVLEMICLTYDLKFSKTGDGYILKDK